MMAPGRGVAATSGGDVSFVDVGDGRPVVLLHGFPLSSHLWRHIVPQLATRMRVIAPDLPGCGDSTAAPNAALDLRAHARYVAELLDGLGVGSFAVVGHGGGGGVAQILAADRAEADAPVDAMVLIDSATADSWPPPSVRPLIGRPSPDEPDPGAAVATILELGLAPGHGLSAADIREYRRPFDGADGASAFARGSAAWDAGSLAGLGAALSAMKIPVLLVWGEEDPLVPTDAAERLQESMATASLALLPGCGHLVPEEAADTLSSLVAEWLRARYLKERHDHAPAGPVVVSVGRRPPPEAEFTGESFDDE
jgi:pimeloyl-ACP methyl ester carboxylesterase